MFQSGATITRHGQITVLVKGSFGGGTYHLIEDIDFIQLEFLSRRNVSLFSVSIQSLASPLF